VTSRSAIIHRTWLYRFLSLVSPDPSRKARRRSIFACFASVRQVDAFAPVRLRKQRNSVLKVFRVLISVPLEGAASAHLESPSGSPEPGASSTHPEKWHDFPKGSFYYAYRVMHFALCTSHAKTACVKTVLVL
jgi:hypothetical protein